MALQKQKATLSFTKGRNDRIDPLQLTSDFAAIENMSQTKQGLLEKRTGYTACTSIEGANQIFNLNNELILSKDNTLYSYSPDSNITSSLIKLYNVNINETKLLATTSSATKIESLFYKGFKAISYNTTDGYCYLTILDINDKVVYPITRKYQTSAQTRLVGAGDYIYFFAMQNGTTLKIEQYSVLNPAVMANPVKSESNCTGVYDVCVVDERPVLAYVSSVSQFLILTIISYSNNFGSPSESLPNPVSLSGLYGGFAFTLPEHISIAVANTNVQDLSFIVSAVGMHNTAKRTLVAKYSTTLQSQKNAIINTYGSTSSLAAIDIYFTNNYTYLLYDSTTAGVQEAKINLAATLFDTQLNVETTSYTALCTSYATALKTFVGGRLASKQTLISNTRMAMVNSITTSFSNTYYLMDLDSANYFNNWKVVSKFLTGYATTNNSLQKITNLSIALPVLTSSFNSISIFSLVLDQPLITTTVDDILYIAGSILTKYDGVNAYEASFMEIPTIISFNDSTSLTPLSAGTYLYAVVYESVDNNGNIERSAPSALVSHTLSSPGWVTITMTTPYFTNKNNVKVCVYRSLVGGSILYKVSSTQAMPSATTGASVSYEDTHADGSISDNEILYTTGGVLENLPTPSCSWITSFQNTLAYGGSECGTKVFTSKSIVPGIAVEFNDTLYTNLKFKPTSSIALDDKIIVFSEQQIAAISGTGPDNLGNQNLSSPYYVSSNKIGCKYPLSLLNTNQGIMFSSIRGIYLLNRGLELTFIGSPVEDTKNLTIIGADFNESKDEAYFYTNQEEVIVYNNLYASFSTYKIKHLISVSNNILLLSNGKVLLPNDSQYTDAGLNYKSLIETGWITLTGLEGFQRVYSIVLHGKFKGAHKLLAQIKYDFEDFVTENISLNPSDILSAPTEADVVYGTSIYGSSDSNTYQFELFPSRQKCSSIKLIISDEAFQNNTFSISGITFIVGIKNQSTKNRSGKRSIGQN